MLDRQNDVFLQPRYALWEHRLDRRYQIFISSTFRDLIAERQAVLKAILELAHMPAGMELFPASDDTAWRLIQDVIDASDYYVLIVGGRYGSLDEEGIGYTEKEYRYAVSTKKPVIPLLHKNPDNLPRDKTETDEDSWERLRQFRDLIEGNHTCVYWENSGDLKSKVIVGVTATVKKTPAIGWVRADNVPSETSLKDILELRNKVSILEAELEATKTTAPSGTEELMQGDDLYELKVSFSAKPESEPRYRSGKRYSANISPSWNDIFSAISPVLINEASDEDLHKELKSGIGRIAHAIYSEREQFSDHVLSAYSISDDAKHTILVQLRALGLIKESDKRRSVRDTATYWTLTPYGDQSMVKLRALSRTAKDKTTKSGEAEQAREDEA